MTVQYKYQNYIHNALGVVEPTHKVGSIVCITKYAKVKSSNGNSLTVTDLHDGGDFQIIGKELQEACMSADKYDETKKMTKTELAEVLATSYGKPFSVVFDKADGSERTLRGRLLSSESYLGRSSVEDLDVAGDNKLRLVDHRTLKSIIVDNIKYTLK